MCVKILSGEFEDGEEIPSKYTCDGKDISPPLRIEDIPSRAEYLAVIADDPDAPGSVFDHWLIWNIPADYSEIPEGVDTTNRVESLGGALQGQNDFEELGYRGPCPPGGTHRYRFKVYAVEDSIDLEPGADKGTLESELAGKTIEEEQLTGIYSR